MPQNDDVSHQTDLIADQELRSDGPPEEAKVARMSEDGVQAMSYKLVVLFVLPCDYMVEAWSGLCHRQASDELPDKDQSNAQSDCERVGECLAILGEESTDDQLQCRTSMSGLVGSAIVEQQEAFRS